MQLTYLRISRAGSVLREIKFKNGLNLILDSPTASKTQSGNNLGKTTALRLIDYCLGSDGSDIWKDSEFGRVNQDVYDFLYGPVPVAVSLGLVSAKGRTHQIERRFVHGKNNREHAFEVDGTYCRNVKEYQSAVKNLLFGTDAPKPTLRQLAPKFLRSDAIKMGRTLKFLGDYSSDAAYEAVHLFLFGFFDVEVLERRPRLDQLLRKQNRDLETLTRTRGEGEIEQLLFHVRHEIEQLEGSAWLRNELPDLSAKANTLAGIRAKAALLSGELAALEAEASSVEMARSDFQRDFSKIDGQVIASIYKEAEAYLPDLHRKWEELKEFVVSLRSRKERFLASQMQYLSEHREKLKVQLRTLEIEESENILQISDAPDFRKAMDVRSELQEALKRLGGLEQDLAHIREIKKAISYTQEQLSESQKVVDAGKATLQERLKVFNRYFSTYSKALYGEQYLLHVEESDRGTLSFKLSAIGANVGTGKKISQTAAFDLAYCEFVKETSIPFPRFICHDGLEAIHDNQLRALLEVASSCDGQLILSTLRDKLPTMPADFLEQNTVLELSQDNKFFGM